MQCNQLLQIKSKPSAFIDGNAYETSFAIDSCSASASAGSYICKEQWLWLSHLNNLSPKQIHHTVENNRKIQCSFRKGKESNTFSKFSTKEA